MCWGGEIGATILPIPHLPFPSPPLNSPIALTPTHTQAYILNIYKLVFHSDRDKQRQRAAQLLIVFKLEKFNNALQQNKIKIQRFLQKRASFSQQWLVVRKSALYFVLHWKIKIDILWLNRIKLQLSLQKRASIFSKTKKGLTVLFKLKINIDLCKWRVYRMFFLQTMG